MKKKKHFFCSIFKSLEPKQNSIFFCSNRVAPTKFEFNVSFDC